MYVGLSAGLHTPGIHKSDLAAHTVAHLDLINFSG
jgi:hypothetical protein